MKLCCVKKRSIELHPNLIQILKEMNWCSCTLYIARNKIKQVQMVGPLSSVNWKGSKGCSSREGKYGIYKILPLDHFKYMQRKSNFSKKFGTMYYRFIQLMLFNVYSWLEGNNYF